LPKFIQGIAVLLLALLVAVRSVSAASVDEMLAERALGDEAAPVTIVEYSSLGCPHCAAFHRETLPKIKEAYIDTGKVRLVYRDYPLGGAAMAAALIARCVEPSRYFGFINMLYRDQATWAASTKPLDDLKQLSRFAGLSEADFNACLENKALLQGIQERASQAQKEAGIDSTPTFFVNDRKIVGAQGFETFKAAIDEALEKAR
jgi:protein-disulfide isomerase